MKLIVGLGNPGEKYVKTRHNLGFEVLEEFGKKMDVGSWKMDKKFKSQILRPSTMLRTQNDNLMLVKPQTYVNNSGMAVKLLDVYYKVAPGDIIVIHDELDLPLGKIKVRLGGAAAGHHGVESIIDALGTDQFIRIRLGIGNLRTQSSEHKGRSISVEKFVLQPFTHSEGGPVKHMVKQAIKALDLLLEKGLDVAQNQFN